MRYVVFPSLVPLTIISLASAQSGNQSKKPEPSGILVSAQFVFVEPYSGTDSTAAIYDPHVSAEDREAVANVQNAILKWGQYKLAIRRSAIASTGAMLLSGHEAPVGSPRLDFPDIGNSRE